MVTSSADAYSVPFASCVVCGDPATPPATEESVADASLPTVLPSRLPSPELCDKHWSDYRTDWLLLGWCVDHYGQALTQCPVHNREIEPL